MPARRFSRIPAVSAILLASLLLCLLGPCTVFADAGQGHILHEKNLNESELYARAAVLMDAGSGRVLFEKNGTEALPMASTTKIMTCILALENASSPDELVAVSGYAAGMPDVQLTICEGEYYRLEDLLYSLMLESHNDSAVAVAEHIGGSVEGFASMMNEKASLLGLADTFFVTPNGLDASADYTQEDGTVIKKAHSTTAADLAAIMSYCIMRSPEKEAFLKITRTASHSFCDKKKAQDGTVSDGSRSFTCNNHNAFLHMMDGALTGKTGFTGNAGYCYVGALRRDGRTFVIALLACGWPGNKTWKWKDARKLFQYGIDNYQIKELTENPPVPEPVPVRNAAGTSLSLQNEVLMQPEVKVEKKMNLLLSDRDVVEVKETLPEMVTAPLQRGTRIGSVDYYVNGSLVAELPVVAPYTVRERTPAWYLRLVLMRYLNP